jgi:hypothetical protein
MKAYAAALTRLEQLLALSDETSDAVEALLRQRAQTPRRRLRNQPARCAKGGTDAQYRHHR